MRICVIGDTHGHLQLALCMAARWQRERAVAFEAVFLCGDVGTFTHESQLDSTTRRHGKANPCELEFLQQWAADPPPSWLDRIFQPEKAGGLGLTCPVVMVHGNHEGFAHLATLVGEGFPDTPVTLDTLPAVDTAGHLRYLPSGWRGVTRSGAIVAGIGGIERGQRHADYPPLAYIDEEAVLRLLDSPPSDILITHQGPEALQGETGSAILQLLLDAQAARVWFHGHSIPNPALTRVGEILVVPLGDVAFPGKGPAADDPGEDAWAMLTFDPKPVVVRERPVFWRDYRRRRWTTLPDGRLVCPDLSEGHRGRGTRTPDG